MTQMFDETADFSSITGKKDLCVSDVIQKVFIEVNEKGSEAAAATAVMQSKGISMSIPKPKFVVDHPFLFFIKDKLTNMVLFMGRVVDPTLKNKDELSSEKESIEDDSQEKSCCRCTVV